VLAEVHYSVKAEVDLEQIVDYTLLTEKHLKDR